MREMDWKFGLGKLACFSAAFQRRFASIYSIPSQLDTFGDLGRWRFGCGGSRAHEGSIGHSTLYSRPF